MNAYSTHGHGAVAGGGGSKLHPGAGRGEVQAPAHGIGLIGYVGSSSRGIGDAGKRSGSTLQRVGVLGGVVHLRVEAARGGVGDGFVYVGGKGAAVPSVPEAPVVHARGVVKGQCLREVVGE